VTADAPDQPTARTDAASITELPFLDEHSVQVDAPTERAWEQTAQVTRRWVEHTFPRLGLAGAAGPLLARMLRSSDVRPPEPGPGAPRAIVGFHVAHAERPSLIELQGEHRFSRYALTFRITPAEESRCIVTAETSAAFPGRSGRVYRKAVIGTGAHVLVVKRLLASIKDRAERV
jgi:hypothetical protein